VIVPVGMSSSRNGGDREGLRRRGKGLKSREGDYELRGNCGYQSGERLGVDMDTLRGEMRIIDDMSPLVDLDYSEEIQDRSIYPIEHGDENENENEIGSIIFDVPDTPRHQQQNSPTLLPLDLLTETFRTALNPANSFGCHTETETISSSPVLSLSPEYTHIEIPGLSELVNPFDDAEGILSTTHHEQAVLVDNRSVLRSMVLDEDISDGWGGSDDFGNGSLSPHRNASGERISLSDEDVLDGWDGSDDFGGVPSPRRRRESRGMISLSEEEDEGWDSGSTMSSEVKI
jgi:hypothetical protein